MAHSESQILLGLDPLSSMSDKVIFCRALWYNARGRCQIQTFR